MNQPWIRTALVLIIFTAVFLALVVGCYRQESATTDEQEHLGAGYAALRFHDYRIDPQHPPLLRMWAALPLLTMHEVRLDTNSVYWLTGDEWRLCHQFVFQDNDADRLLFRARFMIALLGLLLGILIFGWARELFGFWPATISLGLYCTEPNLLAHSGLVTTDVGVTCFIFGAVYFSWRVARCLSLGNLTGLAVFFVLAQVSKYSAVCLGPILFFLLLLRAVRAAPWRSCFGQANLIGARTSRVLLTVSMMGGLVLASYVAFWAVYSFRYSPTPAGIEEGVFIMGGQAHRHFPQLMRLMQWVDEHHLLPNACAQGFASMVATTQGQMAYLLGNSKEGGWWYYFPVAFLIKTPLALLLMAFSSLIVGAIQWKRLGSDLLFVLGPPAVYFGTAMVGDLNIGLRHVLVVYPFVLLLAGWTIAALFPAPVSSGRGRWRSFILAALCLAQVAELAAIYPHCLAFFNMSIGGPRHGADYLVDSNLDWGQDLKLLKRWMTQHEVQHINLSYFGTADPTYYGIDYTPLRGAPFFDLDRITKPQLPGYVAVSVTHLRGAYLSDYGRNFYALLREHKPVAVLGYSIYVYWVEKPWW